MVHKIFPFTLFACLETLTLLGLLLLCDIKVATSNKPLPSCQHDFCCIIEVVLNETNTDVRMYTCRNLLDDLHYSMYK